MCKALLIFYEVLCNVLIDFFFKVVREFQQSLTTAICRRCVGDTNMNQRCALIYGAQGKV